MKKTIGIFGLSVLLFSTLAPSFTYATGEIVDNNENNTEIVNSDVGIFVDNDTDNLVDNIINDSDPLVSQLDLSDSLSPFDEPEITTLETTHDYLERCFPGYDYNSYGTLSLYNYVCEDTDVIIPVSESGDNKYTVIMENAFVGKTITSIQFPEKVTVRNAGFSGAILDGTITIGKNVNLSSPDGWIIGEHGHLIVNKQIYNVYRIVVNGTFTYDITDYKASNNISQMSVNEFLDKSVINGTVNLVGFDSINRSFSNSEITENGIINIGEGVTSISEYSFGGELYDNSSDSLINGAINFPESLTTIQGSFNYSTINSELYFPESLKNIQSSFYYSNILRDINFLGNGGDELFTIDGSFGYSNIGGLEFSGLNISLNNVSPQTISGDLSFINSRFTYFNNFLTIGDHIISGDVNFINTDLNLNGGQFFRASTIVGDFNFSGENYVTNTNGSTVPIGLKIGGNLNITGINVLNPIFQYSEITGSVNINASTMNLQYSLNNSKIKGHMTIIGDDITAKYGSLNNLSISGDFLMSGNNLDLQTDVLNGLKIDGNFEIKGGLLKAYYGVLNGLNVYGDIKLPRNSEFGPGTLGGVIAKGNYIISYDTTVSIGDSVNNAQLSNDVKIVADEIESSEINANDDKIVIQNSEIVATSGMVVEYEGGLKVNFQDNGSSDIEGTAKFSAPIAVKVPVKNINNNFVKVMVKHQGDEDFGFTGLTLSQENVCEDGLPKNSPYSGEDVAVEENNGERYAVIYTCSASTFVAYTENEKKIENNTNENVSNNTSSSSVGGGSTISVKSNTTVKEQEHNSADTEKTTEKENNSIQLSNKTETTSVEQKVRMVGGKSLTRGEVAVMTNILLDVYPQLTENKTLNEVSEACENYADEQNFTKDEKKAITRLCKLSIMGIHKDTKEPLDEFLAKQKATNGEFATVMDRAVENYTEKDLSVVKEALKKLEGNEENVVFGTVYDVFMSIKNIFG